MSATVAADAVSPGAPKGKGKGKGKLMLILVVLLVLLAGAGGGAFYIMKKNVDAAMSDDDDDGVSTAKAVAKPNLSQSPTYVALDPFVVNLADKESERYMQVAVTLQVDDAKFAEQMKGYMPSIRNSILLVLAHKTSKELLDRAGKDALAAEIMREAVRPMGIEIEPEDKADEAEDGSKKKKKKRRPAVHNPVTHVHFANFIIQ